MISYTVLPLLIVTHTTFCFYLMDFLIFYLEIAVREWLNIDIWSADKDKLTFVDVQKYFYKGAKIKFK